MKNRYFVVIKEKKVIDIIVCRTKKTTITLCNYLYGAGTYELIEMTENYTVGIGDTYKDGVFTDTNGNVDTI